MRNIGFVVKNRGFGPIAKAISIAKMFRNNLNNKLLFYGDETGISFANKANVFHEINTLNLQELIHNLKRIDLFIIVMDQDFALLLYSKGSRFIYVDSLFDYWKFTEGLEIKLEVVKNDREALIKLTSTLTSHDKKLVAHMVAFKSIIQYTNKAFMRWNKYKLILPHSKFVQPIVPSELNSQPQISTQSILVNIGGLQPDKMPIDKMYFPFIESVLLNVSEMLEISNLQIKIRGNNNISKYKFNKKIDFNFQNQEDFLIESISSKYVISIPGLTTIMEFFKFGIAAVFCFEQHDSHLHNFKYLQELGYTGTVMVNDYTNSCQNISEAYNQLLQNGNQLDKYCTDIVKALQNPLLLKQTIDMTINNEIVCINTILQKEIY